jgi:hypothetical protein
MTLDDRNAVAVLIIDLRWWIDQRARRGSNALWAVRISRCTPSEVGWPESTAVTSPLQRRSLSRPFPWGIADFRTPAASISSASFAPRRRPPEAAARRSDLQQSPPPCVPSDHVTQER